MLRNKHSTSKEYVNRMIRLVMVTFLAGKCIFVDKHRQKSLNFLVRADDTCFCLKKYNEKRDKFSIDIIKVSFQF